MAEHLSVWLHDTPVADLRVRGRDWQLTYRPDVVAELGVGTICLSVSLPIDDRPIKGEAVRRWCEGLLPEGETRTSLEQQFGIRRGDTFGLLDAIGRDCAGAVAFRPASEQPRIGVTPTVLTEREALDALEDLPKHPLGADDDTRVSLGGLQAKLLLVRTPSGWARPADGFPSTHIIKPDPTDVRTQGLVVAEGLAMRAAAMAGVRAASVELENWGGRATLVVERYDRRFEVHRVTRIHQEDGCQALGVEPTGPTKYQSDSPESPSYAKLAAVLRDHAADPREQWIRLGEAMTLSVAVGNTDAHARNHSFLLDGGIAELSPLYDVAPTRQFASSRDLALRVAGQQLLPFVTRGHLKAEMRSWGMSESTASEVIERTLTCLGTALPEAAAELAVVPEEVLDGVRGDVRRLLNSAVVEPA